MTTGLLSTVGYLKDNRLLPHGFKKETAPIRTSPSSAMQRATRTSRIRAIVMQVFGSARKRVRPVSCGSRVVVSADWISLGAQPGRLQSLRAAEIRGVLRVDEREQCGSTGKSGEHKVKTQYAVQNGM